MPRAKKKPHEMTTDEAIKHLFPKPAVDHLKKVAKQASENGEKPSDRAIRDKSNG